MSRSRIFLALALLPVMLQASETREDFSAGSVPEGWPAAKGEWVVMEGSLQGKEVASDEHAAVLTIPASHLDSSISFQLRMEGAKGFHLSYNHPKGHLFRIRYDGSEVALVIDKDKKDPKSKAVTLAKEEVSMKAGQVIQVSCSAKGDTVTAMFGDVTLSGTHGNLSMPKTGFRFIVQGESVAIDDIVYSTSES